LAFGGTRTYHRLACAIEDGGFEIRDCLLWLYGQGMPKQHNISKAIDKAAGAERKVVGSKVGLPGYSLNQCANPGGVAMSGNVDNSLRNPAKECEITAPATDLAQQFDGYSTCLKPAWEPIIMAMRSLDGTFAHNAAEHGLAGMNIDACRITTEEDLGGGVYAKKGGRQGLPGDDRAASGLFTPGKTSETPYVAPAGRWPANLLLDGLAGALLDEQAGNSTSRKGKPRKSKKPGKGYGMTHTGAEYNDSGGPSRFFYCAKATKRERTCDGQVENLHPTVKPLKLMKWLCQLVTPPSGGLILDPFMGSGTTGMAALDTGNSFVGIEMEEESFNTAKERILCGPNP
jgi:site-specific DNA-methyltransferase (adenine-specific)